MKIKYSIGNRKIGKDTMIINISSAKDCEAGKNGLCDLYTNGKCYAMKAERLYPQVLPYREEQKIIWESLSAKEISDQIIEANNKKRSKLKFLRINESGDFKHQGDVWKASEIAQRLSSKGIKVYTYTHRKDLDFSDLSDNLTINSSHKDKLINNRFLAYKENVINRIMRMKKNRKIVKCVMDCSKCNICKYSNNLTVLVSIH